MVSSQTQRADLSYFTCDVGQIHEPLHSCSLLAASFALLHLELCNGANIPHSIFTYNGIYKLKYPKSLLVLLLFFIGNVFTVGTTSCQHLVNLCHIYLFYLKSTRQKRKPLTFFSFSQKCEWFFHSYINLLSPLKSV